MPVMLAEIPLLISACPPKRMNANADPRHTKYVAIRRAGRLKEYTFTVRLFVTVTWVVV